MQNSPAPDNPGRKKDKDNEHPWAFLSTPAGRKEFMKDIGYFSEDAVRHLFRDARQLCRASSGYGKMLKNIFKSFADLRTPTELYLLHAVTEGFILKNLSHANYRLQELKGLKDSNDAGPSNQQVCLFDRHESLWYSSVSTHYWAIDTYPTYNSFTQLCAVFVLGHEKPQEAKAALAELKKDSILYNRRSNLWTEMRILEIGAPGMGPVYLAKDQLMSILVEALYNRPAARRALNNFKKSQFCKDGICQNDYSEYRVENPYQSADQIKDYLLILAELYTLPPGKRKDYIDSLKSSSDLYDAKSRSWKCVLEAGKPEASDDSLMCGFICLIIDNFMKSYQN